MFMYDLISIDSLEIPFRLNYSMFPLKMLCITPIAQDPANEFGYIMVYLVIL